MPSMPYNGTSKELYLMSPQEMHELREARSEIARHHRLITDMREALEWALPITKTFGQGNRLSDVLKKHDEYRKLLNRQVS